MGKFGNLIKESLQINLLTLIVLGLVYILFNGFFPFFSSGKDSIWLLSKYVTLKNNSSTPIYNDNILICNIAGINSRDSIATIIEKIQSYKPKAIGCDIIFSKASGIDSLHNSYLESIIAKDSTIITAIRPILNGTGGLSSVERSFFNTVKEGDVTVSADGTHNRETTIEGVKFINFASMVAESAQNNLTYPTQEYSVNYTNKYFPVMGIDQIIEEDVKDKIVLIGDTEDLRDYVHLNFYVSDFRYHETLTTSYRVPGIFLHAYTIDSIIGNDWIIMLPKWVSLIFGFIASFLLCLVGRYWAMKGIPRCYFKIVHMILFTLMIWIGYPLYLWFNVIISPLYFTIGVAMSDFSAAGLDVIKDIKGKLFRKKHD